MDWNAKEWINTYSIWKSCGFTVSLKPAQLYFFNSKLKKQLDGIVYLPQRLCFDWQQGKNYVPCCVRQIELPAKHDPFNVCGCRLFENNTGGRRWHVAFFPPIRRQLLCKWAHRYQNLEVLFLLFLSLENLDWVEIIESKNKNYVHVAERELLSWSRSICI